MPDPVEVINIFVSYSHDDSTYLGDNSLLGYLKGLENDRIEFRTDRQIRVGELWDEVIKTRIQDSHIALVLVSQSFLDSAYCQDVEIKNFLAAKSYLFPIILSPCEWQRHEWLRSRQFLPGGKQTIEGNYTNPGQLKQLFLEI
ncbi:MAG: toll/interleukin-1 receptor domain-containing protein, partial [Candidatus Tectomicrobia bacterium]|nr:toll/interleukin-1 receptor domain-containing protein [Candidatus Tectomicrobia bacterium]